MKGRVLEVMIEGKVADENAFVGRTPKAALTWKCPHQKTVVAFSP